jgi:peptidoglycan/xylan/chitin deacetylase (PgdA/CDA1 family)
VSRRVSWRILAPGLLVAGVLAATAGALRRPAPAGAVRRSTKSSRPATGGVDAVFGVQRRLLVRGLRDSTATPLPAAPGARGALRVPEPGASARAVRGIPYPRLVWGPSTRREVLLTFDDGPDPRTTPQVLEILKREHVPAVFFLVGRRAADHPDLVRREVEEGHDVGNHTWHHVYLTRMDAACARAQIAATDNCIRAIIGRGTRWFRPPGGHYNPDVLRACRHLNQVIVLWSDHTGDWLHQGPAAIEARGLRFLKPGAIILMHDTLPESVAALPDFIHQVRARGYRFVPISRFAPAIVGR